MPTPPCQSATGHASQSPTTHETRAKHGQSRDERTSEQTALSSAQALAQKHSTSKRRVGGKLARTYCKQASSKNANTAVPERDRPRASQSPTTHETRAKHGQSRDERPSEQTALSSAQARPQKHSTSKRTYSTASEHRPRMPTPPCQSATGHARHNHQPDTRLERSTVSRVMRGQASRTRSSKAQRKHAHKSTAPASARTRIPPASEHRPRMPTPPCQSATGHARHNHQPHTRLERSTVSRVMRGQASRPRSAQRKHSHKSTAPASARTYCKQASSKNANTAVPERDRPRASQSPTTRDSSEARSVA